jgi:hypothetical protein
LISKRVHLIMEKINSCVEINCVDVL